MEIFIDETGDNGLDFSEGKSEPWFIITAIIVEPGHVEDLIANLNGLANRFLGGGEIKSRKLKSNDTRIKFISESMKLNWRGYILQVDKTNLVDYSGFEWKKSFYKYIPAKVYDYLIAIHQKANLYPDPVGDKEFQTSLTAYIIKKNPLDLFDENNFNFLPANANRITQLADFCSGTLFRDLRDGTNNFQQMAKKFYVRIWPRKFTEKPDVTQPEKDLIDDKLLFASYNLATSFFIKHQDSKDKLHQEQCRLIEILLDEIQNGDKFRYLPCHTLKREIGKLTNFKPLGDYYFRSKIIGKLRSQDVLIVSNRRGGYKLPVNETEIEEYFNNLNDKVEPMIQRANIVAGHLKTIIGTDIFENPKWHYLKDR